MNKQEIESLIAAGDAGRAAEELRGLWREQPAAGTANFVISALSRLGLAPARRAKLAFLRSFTLEPVLPLLRASCALEGIDVEVKLGDFNAYAQEILDGSSWLYGLAPDIAFLAVLTRDVAPDLWSGFAELGRAQVTAAIARVVTEFETLAKQFRGRSPATLVLHALEIPPRLENGILDPQSPSGQEAAIREINRELRRIANEIPGVFLLDYDGLIARRGRDSWYDESKWRAVRFPIASATMPALAAEWLRYVVPLVGRSAKVLALDLDNTLWGGIIGEDGLDGIRIGPEGAGQPYHELQRAVRTIAKRGILLAIVSKNNLADALEALERHPGMLLRAQDFAALRINWQDKAANLREVAAELNVGVDAIAFFDDNPVERAWVREQVPEAIVLDVPLEPARFARVLMEAPTFERLRLSDEDRERSSYYAQQRMRDELKNQVSDIHDFYRSLEMKVEVARLSPDAVPRVAQLTQKTNQFNMTTRRYQEQEILAFGGDGRHRVYTIRAADRFGDNGLVGVLITASEGDACRIDTFLLSCRVIGRTIETAILSALAQDARHAGHRRLLGEFLPTRKNAPAQGVYRDHGFILKSQDEHGSLWELDLLSADIPCPEWIQMQTHWKGLTV